MVAREGKRCPLRRWKRRRTTAIAASAARLGKMLDLIVVTIVMMSGDAIVMIALAVVRNLRQWA